MEHLRGGRDKSAGDVIALNWRLSYKPYSDIAEREVFGVSLRPFDIFGMFIYHYAVTDAYTYIIYGLQFINDEWMGVKCTNITLSFPIPMVPLHFCPTERSWKCSWFFYKGIDVNCERIFNVEYKLTPPETLGFRLSTCITKRGLCRGYQLDFSMPISVHMLREWAFRIPSAFPEPTVLII